MLEKPLLFISGCCILAACAMGSGCAHRGRESRVGDPPADLADRFQAVPVKGSSAPESEYLMRHFPVTRRGRRLDTLTLKAPAAVQAPLAGYPDRCALNLMAAQPFNIGDGLQLDVTLRGSGSDRVVYRRYFDAARRAADRDWIPLEIPLDLGGLAEPQLEIRISAGPQGDLDADWLALAEIRILPERATR